MFKAKSIKSYRVSTYHCPHTNTTSPTVDTHTREYIYYNQWTYIDIVTLSPTFMVESTLGAVHSMGFDKCMKICISL